MSTPENPMTAAQQNMRPALPKRFYKLAGVLPHEEGFAVALDGRLTRTPSKRVLAVPSQVLADAMAEEWNGQGEVIDPATMPLTRLVNSALDGVASAMEAVRADVVAYAGSDLLCYRADEPEKLAQRQAAAWDPVLAWALDELGGRFVLVEGLMHVAQPEEALDAVGRAVVGFDIFQLAAVHSMTTLTGSALLALAVQRGLLGVEAAWQAAHVDEDWTAEHWGRDAEAEARRAARWQDMQAAGRVLVLG